MNKSEKPKIKVMSQIEKVQQAIIDDYKSIYIYTLRYADEWLGFAGYGYSHYACINVNHPFIARFCDAVIIGIYSDKILIQNKQIRANLTSIVSHMDECGNRLIDHLVRLSNIENDTDDRLLFEPLQDEYEGVIHLITLVKKIYEKIHSKLS